MIVVDGNSLADIDAISHVDIVMKDGIVWHPEPSEDDGLLQIDRRF